MTTRCMDLNCRAYPACRWADPKPTTAAADPRPKCPISAPNVDVWEQWLVDIKAWELRNPDKI